MARADGEVVARAFSLPAGWGGHMLYVQETALKAYCASRGGESGWIVWGERGFMSAGTREPPTWLTKVRQAGADRFSRVVSLADLSG